MLKNLRLEASLVVLDLETTGKRTHVDRIVEISTLKLSPDGTRQHLSCRLDPGIPISPEATAIHGITDADVAGAKTFGQIARRLALYLEGCDLCGYNLWSFDLKLLIHEFRRVRVPFSAEGRRILDPYRIFCKREPRDLSAAVRFYCGMEHEGAHRADADVAAALLVLEAQLERYEDLPRSVAELHEAMEYPDLVDPDGKFLRREDGRIVINFGQHRGTPVDELARADPGFLEWMLKKDFSDEAKAIVRQALEGRRMGSAVLA